MKYPRQSKAGFTIVELLIVISAIAILATIVVVAYSGVQQRASDTKTATGVKHFQEALESYNAMNGSYPPTSGSVCLGTGYSGGKCWAASVNESTTFMDALKPYGDSLPKLEQGVYLKGGLFSPASNGNKLDGVNRDFIAYIVGKSGKCPLGPVVTYISGQLFSSTAPSSEQTAAPNAFGDVQCWIVLEK